MSSEDPLVLVTGASGYIATHIVQQLQEGGYRVRGTVRSLQNEEKVKAIRELCPGARYPLELVEADLTREDGWMEAVQDCTYVLHTASPIPVKQPKNEMELIGPAVEGTLSVLRACKAVGGVKRVVVTSSVASIAGGFEKSGKFSEKDWTDVKSTNLAYVKSKTLAEKAAWDFIDELPEESKFELAVINPSFVVGPVLCGGWATSMEIPKRLLEHAMPAVPRINLAMVDVRDVAAAHLAAMTQPGAAGKRHITSTHSMWVQEMAMVLEEEFKPLGYKVPVGEAPYCIVKMISLCVKDAKMLIPPWGKVVTLDNTRMIRDLGIRPRAARDSLIEMGHSLIQKRFIKRTDKYNNYSQMP